MSNSELKALARRQLGDKIFENNWMLALLVCLIQTALLGAGGTVVPGVGILLISGPVLYGVAYLFLKQARDGMPMKIGDIFCGFQSDFSGTFLLGLMTDIYIILWALLLIVPGFIMAYAYSMAYFIKAEHPDYDWRRCLNESREIMQGNKWRLFCLDLSFIGWFIVSIFTLGIGLLWVVPYMQAARAQFYEDVRRR